MDVFTAVRQLQIRRPEFCAKFVSFLSKGVQHVFGMGKRGYVATFFYQFNSQMGGFGKGKMIMFLHLVSRVSVCFVK